MQVFRPVAAIAAVLSAGALSTLTTQAQPDRSAGEWRAYAGSPYALKYSPLDQINKDNVKDLEIVWRGARSRSTSRSRVRRCAVSRNENTPLMVNGVLYTVTGLGLVAALDPGTGQTRWVYDPESYKAGRPNNGGFISRSFGYWTDGTSERLLVGTHDAYLLSIDARTGKPDPAFGTDGTRRSDDRHPRRAAVDRISRRALRSIAGDVVVVGSSIADAARNKETPPGYVQAFDVRTGKLLWTFHTIPRAGEFGYDTWLDDSAEYSGNTNVWGGDGVRPGARLRLLRRPRRRAATTTAAIGPGTICSPRASSASRRRPASGSGTSRPCITACGTTTSRPIRSSATSRSTAGGSRR